MKGKKTDRDRQKTAKAKNYAASLDLEVYSTKYSLYEALFQQ